MALKLLYQDENYVAVHKPSGMLVHHNEFDRHSRAAVQVLRKQFGKRVYPVHRLDRGTSGVMVFAFSPEATAALGEVFQARQVTKTYLAIVRGFLEGGGVIDKPITHPDTKQQQSARSRFQGLAKVTLPVPVGNYPEARYSLVAVQPLTGRQHQIRRHLRSLNHPIVGDTRMGDTAHNQLFRDRFQSNRLLLTAFSLEFEHPMTGEWLTITAPNDGEFLRLGALFGWEPVFENLAERVATAFALTGEGEARE